MDMGDEGVYNVLATEQQSNSGSAHETAVESSIDHLVAGEISISLPQLRMNWIFTELAKE